MYMEHESNVLFWLSPQWQWLCKNSCAWARDARDKRYGALVS